MPLFLAPLVAFAVGTLLALGPRRPLAAREERFATLAGGAFAALCLFPVVAWAAATEPSWSLAYLTDGDRIPPVLVLALAALSSGLSVLGLRTGLALVQAPLERRVALSAAPLLAAAVALAVHADRLSVVGSHLAFVRASERALQPFLSSRFGAVVLGHDLLLALGGALTYRALSSLGEAPLEEPKARFGRPRLGQPNRPGQSTRPGESA